jgi:hypothetical protein
MPTPLDMLLVEYTDKYDRFPPVIYIATRSELGRRWLPAPATRFTERPYASGTAASPEAASFVCDPIGDTKASASVKPSSRRPASPRTSSNHIRSRSAKSALPRFIFRGRGRTIGRKTHTSGFGAKNENSGGSSWLGPLNASRRSTPPSRKLSTSNATFYLALSSGSFEPRRLQPGDRAASQPDQRHGALPWTAEVNVSMPLGRSARVIPAVAQRLSVFGPLTKRSPRT